MPDGSNSINPVSKLKHAVRVFKSDAMEGPRLPEHDPVDAKAMAMVLEGFANLPPAEARSILADVEQAIAQMISHSNYEAAAILAEDILDYRDQHFPHEQFLSNDFYNRLIRALVNRMRENVPQRIGDAHDMWNAEPNGLARRNG